MEITAFALIGIATIMFAVSGAIYASHRIPAITFFGIGFLFIDASTCMFWAAKTEPVEHSADAASGVLTSETLFSPDNNPSPAQFDVCDASPLFVWAGPKNQPFFDIFKGTQLTVERINGAVAVSTNLKDESGKLVAEIARNEWKVKPSLLWDKNFNRDSLEIRDASGDVVLQVTATPEFVRIRGKWRDEGDQFLEITESPDKLGAYIVFFPSQAIPIAPLFQYPSDRHPGELLHKDWKPRPNIGRHTATVKETIRIPRKR